MKKKSLCFSPNYSLWVVACIIGLTISCNNKSASPFSKSAEDALSTFTF